MNGEPTETRRGGPSGSGRSCSASSRWRRGSGSGSGPSRSSVRGDSPRAAWGTASTELTAGINAWLAAEPVARQCAPDRSARWSSTSWGSSCSRRASSGPRSGRSWDSLAIFALRQAMQALTALPPPDGMIWRYPGVPSLLVTYGVASDLFFSGHTSIAVWGGLEIGRLRFRGAAILGTLVAPFEATTVIVLRAALHDGRLHRGRRGAPGRGVRRSVGAPDRSAARPPGVVVGDRRARRSEARPPP